jgi:hypothetical protein
MIFEGVSQGQPLDPKKAFFYGQFVQAAYTVFRNSRGGEPLRPEPARGRGIRPDECRGCHRICHLQRTLADQGEWQTVGKPRGVTQSATKGRGRRQPTGGHCPSPGGVRAFSLLVLFFFVRGAQPGDLAAYNFRPAAMVSRLDGERIRLRHSRSKAVSFSTST